MPDVATSWVGTPFHHAAAIKGVGVDCANLIVAIFVECGLMRPWTPPAPPADWFLHRSVEHYVNELSKVAEALEAPEQVGDICTYRYGRCVSHAGIYVGDGRMVHALQYGVRMVDVASPTFAGRFAGAWRLLWCRL